MAIETTDNSVVVPAFMEPIKDTDLDEMEVDGPLDLDKAPIKSEQSTPPETPDLDELLCHESISGRSSPTLWPEAIPGLIEFSGAHELPNTDVHKSWTGKFNQEETNFLYSLISMSEAALIDKVRDFLNIGYELSKSEEHELARGRLLNILEHPPHSY